MPIRDRIIWGQGNPFSDPRLARLDEIVRDIRAGKSVPYVSSESTFEKTALELPVKPVKYYTEHDVEPKITGRDRGKLRLVLGKNGEVYITGDHYGNFRQIIGLPFRLAAWAELRLRRLGQPPATTHRLCPLRRIGAANPA